MLPAGTILVNRGGHFGLYKLLKDDNPHRTDYFVVCLKGFGVGKTFHIRKDRLSPYIDSNKKAIKLLKRR